MIQSFQHGPKPLEFFYNLMLQNFFWPKIKVVINAKPWPSGPLPLLCIGHATPRAWEVESYGLEADMPTSKNSTKTNYPHTWRGRYRSFNINPYRREFRDLSSLHVKHPVGLYRYVSCCYHMWSREISRMRCLSRQSICRQEPERPFVRWTQPLSCFFFKFRLSKLVIKVNYS